MNPFEKYRQWAGRLRELEISAHAAHACYFLVLSLFPALALLLGILRYTRLQAADLMELVSGFLPTALQPYAWNLIALTYGKTSRMALSASALTAFWSAGKGIYGLMMGLNRINGVEERRGWFRTRLLCALYMVLFILVLLLTLALSVFGSTVGRFLQVQGFIFPLWGASAGLRLLLPVALQSLLFCVVFMYLPGENHSFRESLPGALFASFAWMGISWVFSLYVEHFSEYASLYGSVYAAAMSMLWLYLCINAVFWGAVLNKMLENRKKRKL